MSKIKLITVVGARPQFVKAATLSRAIKEFNAASDSVKVEELIVHTGQHFDANMSDVFFEEMEIPKPAYSLVNGCSLHGEMTGKMLTDIEKLLLEEKPDCVLVYGDTNSTLAGALAAAKLHIPVAHVEAGLRSFNKKMPEEINRIMTDHVSEMLLCPTDTAVVNLANEGFNDGDICVKNVGDVMYDAATYYSSKAIRPQFLSELKDEFTLVTVHRADNTDDITLLKEIVDSLNELSKGMDVVIPLHPRTKKMIEKYSLQLNVTVIDPVSYFEMIWLLKNCTIVLTDSGGLQKEAYFFKKPCLTLRKQTEWVELIEQGVNQLVNINKEEILSKFKAGLNTDKNLFEQKPLYGDGDAAKKVLNILIEKLL